MMERPMGALIDGERKHELEGEGGVDGESMCMAVTVKSNMALDRLRGHFRRGGQCAAGARIRVSSTVPNVLDSLEGPPCGLRRRCRPRK